MKRNTMMPCVAHRTSMHEVYTKTKRAVGDVPIAQAFFVLVAAPPSRAGKWKTSLATKKSDCHIGMALASRASKYIMNTNDK